MSKDYKPTGKNCDECGAPVVIVEVCEREYVTVTLGQTYTPPEINRPVNDHEEK